MQLIIQGKNIELTDWLRQYVERKTSRLDRYLPDIQEIRVELSTQKTKSAQDRQVAQITIRANRAILRAEEKSHDIFAAIDAVVDKMYRQIDRYKGKRWRKRGPSGLETASPMEAIEEEVEEEESPRIVRVKRFAVTPMLPEEAIEQMELLGHDFFIFYNPDDEGINVIYRRADGDYGLLQPELV
ncbi:MAG: ribosome-associated translation inhibitor RaiA [Chloroflexi bacterium]|nr:ribosome-associated translation inhibitor RaiA [Chloroflexota bacterium]